MKTTAKKRYAAPAMEMVMLQHQVCLMQGTTDRFYTYENYQNDGEKPQYQDDLGW